MCRCWAWVGGGLGECGRRGRWALSFIVFLGRVLALLRLCQWSDGSCRVVCAWVGQIQHVKHGRWLKTRKPVPRRARLLVGAWCVCLEVRGALGFLAVGVKGVSRSHERFDGSRRCRNWGVVEDGHGGHHARQAPRHLLFGTYISAWYTWFARPVCGGAEVGGVAVPMENTLFFGF